MSVSTSSSSRNNGSRSGSVPRGTAGGGGKAKNLTLKTTTSSVEANSAWLIDDIVDGPKFETVKGKKVKMYKVKWSQSFEPASNIPPQLIEIFEKRGQKSIRVIGPIADDTREQLAAMDETEVESSGRKKAHNNIKRMKFAVEIGDEVEVMSYKQVRLLYKDELFDYFEERAKLSDGGGEENGR